MKQFLKLRFLFVLCMVLSLTLVHPFAVYADLNDLMIGSSSNALMTLDLNDDDYGVSTYSSLANVTNTVGWDSDTYFLMRYKSKSSGTENTMLLTSNNMVANSDGIRVKATAPDGWYWTGFVCYFKRPNLDYLPPSGVYSMSVDLSSNFGCTWLNPVLWTLKNINNASNINGTFSMGPYFDQSSGDFYVRPFNVDVSNCNQATFDIRIDPSEQIENVDFIFKVNFTKTSGNSVFEMAGSGISDTSYQDGISSSLSDLSSSVDDMSDEISGVTEAIQNLQGAMEPHYSNVLTQLHHITEQLHAFYDQIYNNIHLKEYALWQDIKSAIENIDLQIEVDISEVKTAINNMSVAVQNKLQSTTDQITGGYDNSGLESDKSELDGVLNQYEQAEEDLFEDAKGNINDFEFDTPLEAFTGPLSDVSYFLSGLFEAMGPMNVVITFSLTLTIAMVMIGWYRFKGGR